MPDGPSAHLLWTELACHDQWRTPYPLVWRDTRGTELAELFEAFRAWCGGDPLIVLSAYRTPEWNRLKKGAKRSQHIEGRALDLTRHGWTAFHLYREARAFAESYPHLVGGIGQYPTFVHLDMRETARLVAWQGARPQAEVT